ncbi:zonular occludens toxin domain-containing protein [Streptococcus marmotae]|uniref:zonular occludens toxin domain-containing protein n=1 Tax=Streptococcus marmotae TaxID=1825069 RepID=UPI0008324203|nr:zonular occludens toxin domain-containing protein [Streptococcus marmotae]
MKKKGNRVKGQFETLSEKPFGSLVYDMVQRIKNGREFKEYGLTLYCGRQGGGKTMAMTEYLERMRKLYPEALIVTNFGYIHQDLEMTSWQQIFEIRNGLKGVIFAIDEIQNEYNSSAWQKFPEGLLAEITQQRKQRIKIVGTSQVFTRVVKQLREQTYEVVECQTVGGRWTFTRAFDAEDYNAVCERPEAKAKIRRLWRRSFVQNKKLREKFDSYAKIERMAKEIKG